MKNDNFIRIGSNSGRLGNRFKRNGIFFTKLLLISSFFLYFKFLLYLTVSINIKCFSNGLNINELKSSPFKTSEHVKYLEMFFVGFPTIMHMDKFPNLTELKIIAQDIVVITGLETCLNLSELWIAECKLKVSYSILFLRYYYLITQLNPFFP